MFAYATDPTRFHEWQAGVIDGHLDGSRATQGRHPMPDHPTHRRRESNLHRDLTHVDPPRTWGVRGIDGPIRAIVDLTVEPLTHARSRLTISVDFDGHGIGKVLVPLLVRREARHEMPANLAALKQQLEAG